MKFKIFLTNHRNPKHKSRSLFQVYKLKVERRHGHWAVELIPHWYLHRRYNDFVRLDGQLAKEFPSNGFDLPPKKWLGDNFDPVFLGRRISGLGKYLKRIMHHPEASECAAFRRFLCMDKPPQRACSISSSRVRDTYFVCLFERIFVIIVLFGICITTTAIPLSFFYSGTL